MMFGEWVQVPGAPCQSCAARLAPLLLLVAAALRRHATLALSLLVALSISFMAISLFFGNRLADHHSVSLLPFFYAALASDSASLLRPVNGRTARMRSRATPLLVLVAINVNGQAAESRQLVATRGVGLMSDVINRFAADIMLAPASRVLLPRSGAGAADRVSHARHGRPDSGRRLRQRPFAPVLGPRRSRVADQRRPRRPARRLDAALAWNAPEVASYRQATGLVVFDVATYRGDTRGPGCR